MKKITIIFVSFFLFLPITYTEQLEIKSQKAILYNLNDNQILYEINASEQTQIASLTKIMTTLVAIEANEDLNKKVVITKEMVQGYYDYAKVGFKVGDEVTILDLLYGVMLPSGADAALAVALTTSPDIATFVDLMNHKASQLELSNTNYSNPIGSDSTDNYSTLEDLVKLLKYALQNEIFYQIYTTKTYTISNLNLTFKSTLQKSSDKYHLNSDFILGSKSGTTEEAGLCLSSITTINNVNYLLITTGAPLNSGYPYHILDAINIYDYYSTNYSYQVILEKGQVLAEIPIEDAFQTTYQIIASDTIDYFLENNFDKEELIYTYTGITQIDSTINQGDKLGIIQVQNQDEILYTEEVYLEEQITFKHTKFWLTLTIIVILVILIISLILKKIKKKRQKRKKKR